MAVLQRVVPILALSVLLPLHFGCSGSEPPPTAEEANLKSLAILVGRYRSTHRGAPPKDAEQLKQFAKTVPADQLKGIGVDMANLDKLFVSSRDQKPFVFRTAKGGGVPQMGPDGKPVMSVMVYEQEGKEGKRMVAYSTGQIDEVDETKFKQLVPDAK